VEGLRNPSAGAQWNAPCRENGVLRYTLSEIYYEEVEKALRQIDISAGLKAA
jgi:hypothetical protein